MSKTVAFNTVAGESPKRNKFDLSHEVKFTGRVGWLMPSMVMECIPGDSISLSCQQFARFQPLSTPTMQRFDITTHYFFVPNRLTMQLWEEYITQRSVIQLPFLQFDGTESSEIRRFYDYMGIPPNDTGASTQVNALPFAAYQMIYNEYYRDQNLISQVNFELAPGDNTSNTDLTVLRNRAYAHDYFTSALPNAQSGAAVDIPLGEIILDPQFQTGGVSGKPFFVDETNAINSGTINNTGTPTGINVGAHPESAAYDPDGTLLVEPVTINSLRRAFQVQAFLELLNRGGKRFKEFLMSMFGVNSSDARLQRPEYITGIKNPLIISEVLNTTGLDGELPQGNMAGHAVAVGDGHLGNFFCEEYGYIIGITSVRPLAAYAQGIPRTYLKKDPLDFFTPKLANIGEMAIMKQELYAYNAPPYPTATFGYTPQYSDYRWLQSRIAGDFRTTLAAWTGIRLFDPGFPPQLNQDFIEIHPEDVERIFAVEDGSDEILISQVNIVIARRPVPVFGTPQL